MSQVPLVELCDPKQWPTVAVKNFTETGFPVYGANGVIGAYSEYTHELPTVLIGCRGSVGAINVTKGPAYVNGNAMALDNLKTGLITVDYLAWFLRFRGFTDVVSGSSQPQITKQNLSRVAVPVPSLDRQKEICDLLNSSITIASANSSLNNKLHEIRASIFDELSRKSQSFERLEAVAKISSGSTPSRSNNAFWGGEIPWIKSGELHAEQIQISEESITSTALDKCSLRLLPVGTVLLAMYGATAGVVSELAIEATTNQAVCALIPGERIHSSFLRAALQSKLSSLLHLRAGGAQQNLSLATIKSFEIPIPALAVQQEFVALSQKVSVLLGKVEQMESLLTDLTSAIMFEVFETESA